MNQQKPLEVSYILKCLIEQLPDIAQIQVLPDEREDIVLLKVLEHIKLVWFEGIESFFHLRLVENKWCIVTFESYQQKDHHTHWGVTCSFLEFMEKEDPDGFNVFIKILAALRTAEIYCKTLNLRVQPNKPKYKLLRS